MTVQLREFVPDDYEDVYRLWQHAGPGIGLGFSDNRDQVSKKLERDPELFLVAIDAKRIIGMVIGGYDGRRGLIYHLAVEQAHRRRGTGTLLMSEVERRLKEKGCQRCFLLVKKDVGDIVAYYRQLGWESWDVTIMGKTLGKR